MSLYGKSDQPVSASDAGDLFLPCKVKETLRTAMMDLRTFQNPLELFTLMPFELIVKKCLVGYVVSVAGGMVDSFILIALPTQWHCQLLKHSNIVRLLEAVLVGSCAF